ncbi:MAG: HYC_CC_PP family protein [Flavobacteriaceae bacterium]
MQKSVSIILAMWVLLLSTHIPLHAHFCCDTLVETSLFKESKSCCANQKFINDQPVLKQICCSNLEVVFDGYDDCSPQVVADVDMPVFVLTDAGFSFPSVVITTEKPLFSGKDPPDSSKVSLYTLFEVYLI